MLSIPEVFIFSSYPLIWLSFPITVWLVWIIIGSRDQQDSTIWQLLALFSLHIFATFLENVYYPFARLRDKGLIGWPLWMDEARHWIAFTPKMLYVVTTVGIALTILHYVIYRNQKKFLKLFLLVLVGLTVLMFMGQLFIT